MGAFGVVCVAMGSFAAGAVFMFLVARNNQKLAAKAFGVSVNTLKQKVADVKKAIKS